MPRQARILNEKHVYHIMLRGNNREKIFIDDEDKARIVDVLVKKKNEGEFFLYTYCIMDNHIHLVIREGKDSLARIIKRIGTSYASYFNKKYRRVGHVFQDRYRSENVHDDKYLLALIRYVHQNPVKPGIGKISGYKWSSYKEYLSQVKVLVEVEEILGMFSNNRQYAVEEFVRFNHESSKDAFLDIEEEKEIDNSNVERFINEYLGSRNLQITQLKDSCNRQIRDGMIKHLAARSNLSLREIAIKLDINRELVRKIVSKEPSP